MGLWYHDPHLQAASPQQARKLEGRPSHCPQGSRLKGALVAVEQTSTISWYLRMFSYLLMICGLFGLAVGGVVIYGALADGAAAATGLPLSALVLGVAAAVANGITIAAGVLGRAASRNPGRAAALRSLALAGVVASVFGLGLCYATGGQLPTSLIFNLLLMAICVVIAGNLGKSAQ